MSSTSSINSHFMSTLKPEVTPLQIVLLWAWVSLDLKSQCRLPSIQLCIGKC